MRVEETLRVKCRYIRNNDIWDPSEIHVQPWWAPNAGDRLTVCLSVHFTGRFDLPWRVRIPPSFPWTWSPVEERKKNRTNWGIFLCVIDRPAPTDGRSSHKANAGIVLSLSTTCGVNGRKRLRVALTHSSDGRAFTCFNGSSAVFLFLIVRSLSLDLKKDLTREKRGTSDISSVMSGNYWKRGCTAVVRIVDIGK